jgi:hypothetical protein
MQAKNQPQHHVGKNNSGLIWHKNTNTKRETEKDRVVDKHIQVKIVNNGKGCRGDWDPTKTTVVGH